MKISTAQVWWWGLAGAAAGGILFALTRSGRVKNRSQMDYGLRPELLGLLDAWDVEGSFDVLIGGYPGSGFISGGLRTVEAEQAQAAREGLTKSSTLASTAHGRGAAVDIWPVGFDPFRSFDEQPGMREKMIAFADFARSKGFTVGIDWGDYPHVEIPRWTALPFPIPGVAYA